MLLCKRAARLILESIQQRVDGTCDDDYDNHDGGVDVERAHVVVVDSSVDNSATKRDSSESHPTVVYSYSRACSHTDSHAESLAESQSGSRTDYQADSHVGDSHTIDANLTGPAEPGGYLPDEWGLQVARTRAQRQSRTSRNTPLL